MLQKIRKWISMCLCIAVMVTAMPLTAYAETGTGWFSSLLRSATEDTSAFQTLEIREGSLNGTRVVDLLHPSGTWSIQTGKDYYLYGEVKKTAGNDYLQIRFGNEDQTYNGLTFFNPPGGSYTPGAIDHDYLDQLVSYTQIADPVYGTGSTKKVLQDGTMLYHIKDDIADNAYINFAMGLIIEDAAFDGAESITGALQAAVGSYGGDTFTAASSKTADLNMSPKGILKGGFNGTSVSATLGSYGATLTYNLTEKDKTLPVAVIYDKLEYDIYYPANAELKDTEIGFSGFAQRHTTYGTVSVADQGTDGEYKVKHVTISQGYRVKNSTLSVYYRLNFPADQFTAGQTCKTTIKNVTFTLGDQNYDVEASTTWATYTVIDPDNDSTTMSAVNRSEVYNHTIDNADPYTQSFGSAYIKNASVTQPTPRDKTYEADFNTTGTAAAISVITVPLGTSDAPAVTVTGKNAAGQTITTTIENPTAYAYSGSAKKSTIGSATYLLLKASDFGMKTFTSVKAEIGQIRAGYTTSGWTSNWSFDANRAGAFGYFTTGETGIQVKNTFHLYNTDPAYRDIKAGDLIVTTTATSSGNEKLGINSGTTTIYAIGENGSTTRTDSIAAGGKVRIQGSVYPYNVPGALKAGGVTGDATYLKNPVIFLKLPQGMSYTELVFALNSGFSNPLSYEVENVSYLNTTGDGVSLYRVTFTDESLGLGYYTAEGTAPILYYKTTFQTAKSMETKRYEINDLIGVSSEHGMQALPYNGNPTTMNTIVEDVYGLNRGLNYAGATKGTANDQPGFGLQQLAEINVYNSVAVTKIDGTAVSEKWHTYDASDPNSIASLGVNSSGKFRLKIENTSDTAATNLNIMVPIPKAGTDLGDAYMDQASEFDMRMTCDEHAVEASGFTAQYVTAAAVDELNGAFSYETSDAESANAILLSAERVPGKKDETTGGKFEFTFEFTVNGGTAGQQNIWRNAFLYTTSDAVTQYKTGSYVASAVAGGTISGYAYHDLDRNGTMDSEETGISGVTVIVKDADKKILTTTTDSEGYYEFLAVRESQVGLTFQMEESQPLRFNVESGTVTPAADGLSATAEFTAQSVNQMSVGASDFFTLAYHKNSGSGNVPDEKEYVEGAQAVVSVKPDNLLRTGYVFKEWNTMADGTGIGYQPGETLIMNGNTTLYAVWELGSYTITFNYRGADSGNEITQKVLTHNQTYSTGGSLPQPVKTGYVFAGWCNNSSGTSANVKDSSKFTLGSDTTLYVIWTPKKDFGVDIDGDGESDYLRAWDEAVLPDEASVRELVKAGYSFAGWEYQGSPVADGATYGMLAGDDTILLLTLDAAWTPKGEYTVVYDVNGGNETYDNLTPVDWDTKNLTPQTNPTKENYAFAGWKLGSTDTLVKDSDSYGTLAGSEDTSRITLTAAWTEITNNTVHYSTGGGTSYSDKTGVTASDTGLIPETDPVRAGYRFAGWTCDGHTVTAETEYSTLSESSNITLTADWIEKNYTVTYNMAGVEERTKTWNDSGLLPAENPVKAGSTFSGWYYGTTKVESTTTVAQLIPADQTDTLQLRAVWDESAYTIVYDSAGGTYYSPKTAVSYSAAGLLPESDPIKTGYAFAGWYHGDTSISVGSTCGSLAEALTESTTIITLTARWTPKSGYRVVYNSGGGSTIETKTEVSWTDTGLIPEQEPTRTGYAFSGWVCGRNAVTAETSYGSVAASDTAGTAITLVAQWTTGNYTVVYDTQGGTEISSKIVAWGSKNLMPAQSPRKAGASFTGWTYNGAPVTSDSLYSELAGSDEVSSITLTAQYEDAVTDDGGMGTDVQGKVIETDDTPVYKLDVSWGSMRFQFSAQKGWDPDTHTYSTGTQGHWNAEDFDGTNNGIIVANHSNADVEIDFAVNKTVSAESAGSEGEEDDSQSSESTDPLASVIMKMAQSNADEGLDATGIFLGKVPRERAEAPTINAYLRIIGEPDNISILNTETYEKIGVITVTVEAVGGGITPRD